MILDGSDGAQSTKQRLETGFALMRIILEQRRAKQDPGFARSVERDILAHELAELETDLRRSNSLPASPPRYD
jgi:hypothetical protein